MNLEEIFNFENLYKAHQMCRKSKQHKGEVIRFETNLSENIYKLQKSLIKKTYKFGKYKNFIIYEPKKRLIQALPYKDRVVIRCFCDNVIIPKIDKKLINDNVACRKDKGTSYGINRLHNFLRKEYYSHKDNKIYYLKCDIKKYFPSINHHILLNLLKKINFSIDELWFLEKILNEQPDNSETGLALGNQSSQWFALYYLNKVDRLIKEKLHVKHYIRYMDDMILIHRNKQFLQDCLVKIKDVCNKELKLELNEKTQIGLVYNGIDFLGFNHKLTQNGKIIMKIRSSSKRRMIKHLKTLNKLKNKEIIDDDYIHSRINAYKTHIEKSHDSNLKNILSNWNNM